MPFMEFQPHPEVLFASDVNEMLMRQVIAVFDDAADRDAQLGAVAGVPVEGQHVYLKDPGVLEKWDGSAWVDAGSSGASAFPDLTDTPADYTGHAGKVVQVKSGEDGLEFVAGGGGGGGGLSHLGSVLDATAQNGISTAAWTTVASITVTAGSGPVLIFAWMRATQQGAAGNINFRIQRAGSTIGSSYSTRAGAGEVETLTVPASETPGAGSRTYVLQTVASAGTIDKSHAGLIVLGG